MILQLIAALLNALQITELTSQMSQLPAKLALLKDKFIVQHQVHASVKQDTTPFLKPQAILFLVFLAQLVYAKLVIKINQLSALLALLEQLKHLQELECVHAYRDSINQKANVFHVQTNAPPASQQRSARHVLTLLLDPSSIIVNAFPDYLTPEPQLVQLALPFVRLAQQHLHAQPADQEITELSSEANAFAKQDTIKLSAQAPMDHLLALLAHHNALHAH